MGAPRTLKRPPVTGWWVNLSCVIVLIAVKTTWADASQVPQNAAAELFAFESPATHVQLSCSPRKAAAAVRPLKTG